MPEGHRLSQEFALGQRQSAKTGPRPRRRRIEEYQAAASSVDQMLERDAWMERFGGTFRRGLSTGSLIRSARKTDEVNLVDVIRFGRATAFPWITSGAGFPSETERRYLDFRVPLFFLLDRHDPHSAEPVGDGRPTRTVKVSRCALAEDNALQCAPASASPEMQSGACAQPYRTGITGIELLFMREVKAPLLICAWPRMQPEPFLRASSHGSPVPVWR